ncbi:helix-turn-helix domain-containing protein [Nocardia sp. CA-128927]|uniref:helix-turn-helix domain-containing protein n=1 Tax=Nocardia sp. CA-128927 TaxID=3239975 RepID=UPI003D99C42F
MTNSAQEAREALGKRLRQIRRTAGLTGVDLARRAGWHESKVSKIEYGRIKPSDTDIHAYCAHTSANHQLPDLLATLHNIDSAYIEWRQILGTGVKRRQQQTLKLESEATFIRNYQPFIVAGLLQTAEYARAILKNVIEFYDIPDDLDEGVSKRMERQQVLYRRNKRFHFLIGEQSLYTTVGDDGVMAGQLDRLMSVIGLPRVTLGIIPLTAEAKVLMNNFVMFDNRLVKEEGSTAGLAITQPRELALYGRAFDILARQSLTGPAARTLIGEALERRHSTS